MKKFHHSIKMKKIIFGIFGSIIFLTAFFIPIDWENYENQTINIDGTNYSNLSIEKFFEINAYLIIKNKTSIIMIDRIFRNHIREFDEIKKIDFPNYESYEFKIEMIENNSNLIANFNLTSNITYSLLNNSTIYSKIMQSDGKIIFKTTNLKNPEIHISFDI